MIKLYNWLRRLGMICHWSSDWKVLEFLRQGEIRNVRVVVFFGMKYLRDGERTLGASGVVEARWIEW